MSPGDETRTLIGNVEERARLAREHQAELGRLEREAQRQKDIRLLLYGAVVGILAAAGTIFAFWDDLVRNEVRLEQLEKKAGAAKPAQQEEPSWLPW